MNTNLPHITGGYIEITLPPIPNDLINNCFYCNHASLAIIKELNLENLCTWYLSDENSNPIILSRFYAFGCGKISGTVILLYYNMSNKIDNTINKIKHKNPLKEIYRLPDNYFMNSIISNKSIKTYIPDKYI